MRSKGVPDLTRISSKGQIVIPQKLRSQLGIKPGGLFAVLARPKAGLVVLKKIDSKSLSVDLKLFREVEKAWEEIELGRARKATTKRFLEELRNW
jgi:AbrB family looped-hinge helix DNA binding protein